MSVELNKSRVFGGFSSPETLSNVMIVTLPENKSSIAKQDSLMTAAKIAGIFSAFCGSVIFSQAAGGDIDPTGRLTLLNEFVANNVPTIAAVGGCSAVLTVGCLVASFVTAEK